MIDCTYLLFIRVLKPNFRFYLNIIGTEGLVIDHGDFTSGHCGVELQMGEVETSEFGLELAARGGLDQQAPDGEHTLLVHYGTGLLPQPLLHWRVRSSLC